MRLSSAFERVQGIVFVLPALIVLALFLIYPAYYTIRLAFYEGDFHYNFVHYVGLDNFKQLLTNDPDFLDLSKFPPGGALINNLRWVIFYISLSLLIGLGLAVLAVRVRYERVVKTVIFLPMAIAATAVGIIWLFVYSPDPDIGVLNAVLVGFDNSFHPIAWLGRPDLVNYALIFAYVWGYAGDDTWRGVLSRVRAGGRNPLMMADSTNPAHLSLADGLATYSGTLFAEDVHALVRDTVSAARAWHLLGSAYGSPRIAAATVMPGYDETRLLGRSGRAVSRESGEFYDRQWEAALASGTDWVVISTWNEWAENTEVEAGQRFGQFYVWRTQFWTAALKHAPR